eukprot:COSAG04_NODE_1308_length_7288_cov_2.749339_9_plen_91_part_01
MRCALQLPPLALRALAPTTLAEEGSAQTQRAMASAAEAAAPNAAAKRKATFRSASRPDSELAKAVAAFCDGDAPELAFPASLCGAERAALH